MRDMQLPPVGDGVLRQDLDEEVNLLPNIGVRKVQD
jgi:hypothetical protein